MSRLTARFLFLLCWIAAVGGYSALDTHAEEVTFRREVEPILTKFGCNSGACHGAAAGKNGLKLSLRGYDASWDHAALTRHARGRRVNLRRPDQSLLLKKALGEVPHGGGQRFEQGSREHQLLREWIQNGAHGPLAHEPLVTSIEVTPAESVLALDDKLDIRVTAHYSDGSTRDVTSWAKYGVTNDGVAVVDEQGSVAIIGYGESAITAWYQSKISYARVLSAFPDEIPDPIYKNSPRKNYIDDHVLEKLEKLRIAPSPPASDLQFVRRLYLDLLGILPTPREALGFAADASPEKHEQLVDGLLERPEYVDYWTYKLSDLLLLNGRKIRGDALVAFYDFIRQSVAENQPWDEFAREIVTAQGSSVENGAVGYFVLHKDPIDLTETTSQAFLGLAITCARCHNHPMEKWTQDQYYGMANLFARVKLKQGERRDEVLVFADESGDIIHPRTGSPMPPQPLDGEAIALDAKGDRRAHLARWLTAPKNPYFARAAVNRVWKNFFGRGLVDPEDDLRLTNPASNIPLLDTVAKDFADHGFDVKHLIRRIVLSAAYQRSSRPFMGNDHDSVYYSHYIVRRLPAEVILDAYSAATGVPTPFKDHPPGFRALQLRDSQVASYFLQTFGRPERIITCACERTEDSSLTQVLHLSNGGTLDDKITAEDNVITQVLKRGLDEKEVVDELYLRTLNRFPTPPEQTAALDVLSEAQESQDDKDGLATSRRQALEDLLWGLLSSKEFLFNT